MRSMILIVFVGVMVAETVTCEVTMIMCMTAYQNTERVDDGMYRTHTVIRVPLKYNEWAQYPGWEDGDEYFYFEGYGLSRSHSLSNTKADLDARGNASCLFNQVELDSWIPEPVVKKSLLSRLLGK